MADPNVVEKLNEGAKESRHESQIVLVLTKESSAEKPIDDATMEMDLQYRTRLMPNMGRLQRLVSALFNAMINWLLLRRLFAFQVDLVQDTYRQQLNEILRQLGVDVTADLQPIRQTTKIMITLTTMAATGIFFLTRLTPLVGFLGIDEFFQQSEFFVEVHRIATENWLPSLLALLFVVGMIFLFADWNWKLVFFKSERLSSEDITVDFIAEEIYARTRRGLTAIFFDLFLTYVFLVPFLILFVLGVLRVPPLPWPRKETFKWFFVDLIVVVVGLFGAEAVAVRADWTVRFNFEDLTGLHIWNGIVASSAAYLGFAALKQMREFLFTSKVTVVRHRWWLIPVCVGTVAGCFCVFSLMLDTGLRSDVETWLKQYSLSLPEAMMIALLLATLPICLVQYVTQTEKSILIMINNAQRLGSKFLDIWENIKERVPRNLIVVAVWNQEECQPPAQKIWVEMAPPTVADILPELSQFLKQRTGKSLPAKDLADVSRYLVEE